MATTHAIHTAFAKLSYTMSIWRDRGVSIPRCPVDNRVSYL